MIRLLAVCLFAVSLSSQEVQLPPDVQPEPLEAARPATAGTRGPSTTAIDPATPSTSDGDIYMTSPPSPYTTSGLHFFAKSGRPNITAQLGTDTSASSFNIFNSSATSLFRVRADGLVLIGTGTPSGKMTILSTVGGVTGLFVDSATTTTSGTGSEIGIRARVNQTVDTGVTSANTITGVRAGSFGNGAGTLNTTVGVFSEAGLSGAGATGPLTKAFGGSFSVKRFSGATGTIGTGYGVYIADVEATADYAIYSVGEDDLSYFAGSMSIGMPIAEYNSLYALHVKGDVHVNGVVTGTTIKAHYQDIAEWVPAAVAMGPGTVVVLDPEVSNQVMPSSRAYDMTVAGVVSPEPGVVLGEEGPSKAQIATTGRVRVKVDASRGPIRIGDVLVTSDKPGTAMKSDPIDVGGIAIHRPATVVGKALEPLASGEGMILVLLSLQ